VLALAVIVALLWVPGFTLRRGFSPERFSRGWGSGALAVDASLSIAFASVVLLPLYLARAPVVLAPALLGAALVCLVVAAFVRARRRGVSRAALVEYEEPRRRHEHGEISGEHGISGLEAAAFVFAAALLVVPTLIYSGANVDDWWDLSFVQGWIASGHFGFSQMALGADPATGDSLVHPRFLWSAWLMLQSVVVSICGGKAWQIQAGPLAAACIVLVVSAQAALARAIFRPMPRASLLVAAAVALSPAWIWGTEDLPLLVRGYQDKLFAGFVLAPVLVALVIDAARRDGEEGDDGVGEAVIVAAASAATASVHSLLLAMALFASGIAVAVLRGRTLLVWVRRRWLLVAGMLAPALYPIGQALALALTFGDEGISLAAPDNPVVRAHLSLNRIVASSSAAWVVHPGAVFGLVALPALLAVAIAVVRRKRDAGAPLLLALTLVPCALLFVPGVASIAGKVFVPWMLYRLGWFVPVPALLAYALVWLACDSSVAGGRRAVVAAAFAGLVVVLAYSTAADRVRRGVSEHPPALPGAPQGAAAEVYDSLAAHAGRDVVLAPPNFSELVPALTGKPVVAFPERGSLVFSTGEVRAYERLRDRATFYAASTPPSVRDDVAARYGVRWAVLPRRLVAAGAEAGWIWRFGPEALLAARVADDHAARGRCTAGACAGWWSATREGVGAGLAGNWSVVLENRDYFIVERSIPNRSSDAQPEATLTATGRSDAASDAASKREARDQPQSGSSSHADAPGARWLVPFPVDGSASSAERGDVLATVTGTPGADVRYDPPPQFVQPVVTPIWLDGPRAWEDTPADVTIHVDIGVPCRVSAVSLIPHLPRDRREIFEVRVGGDAVAVAARHGEPIVLALSDAPPRAAVDVHVRSLLGTAVSLSDLRLLGDHTQCTGMWPVRATARSAQMQPDDDALLALAAAEPSSGRALVSLARRANDAKRAQAGIELLREAVAREPALVEGWLELGFAEQAVAEQAVAEQATAGQAVAEQATAGQAVARRQTDSAAAAAARARALQAFRSAVHADTHSAWAQGCLAWAYRLGGHAPLALWHAAAAAQLDPLYGDAWTIAGYALGDLRLYSLADRALDVAEREDPSRNWPSIARADVAVRRGDVDGARAALRTWIHSHPFDQAVRAKLSVLNAKKSESAGASAGPVAQ
jgi:hypothetical protein